MRNDWPVERRQAGVRQPERSPRLGRRRTVRSFLILSLVLLTALPERAIAQDIQLAEQIDSIFAPYDSPDSPGCAVGVYRDSELLFSKGYGMADLERRVPITQRSVFNIGSIAKQFHALALMLLVRDGKLTLDDSVRQYVPELPAYADPVRIRHLVTHTSGIRDYVSLSYLRGVGEEEVVTADDVMGLLQRQRRLNYAPGEEFVYTNSGLFLTGEIIQRVSGMTLREFARQRIFEPLDMGVTQYAPDARMLVTDRALGYDLGADGRYRLSTTSWEVESDPPLLTTVEDMARWHANFFSHAVGDASVFTELTTPARLNDGTRTHYGLGLTLDTYRGHPRVWHGGSWAGFLATFMSFTEQRLGVGVLCNASTVDDVGLASSVADLFLPDGDNEVDREESPPQLTDDELTRYAGLYESRGADQVRRITVEDDALVVEGRGPMVAVGADRFRHAYNPSLRYRFLAAEPNTPRQFVETTYGHSAWTFRAVSPWEPAPVDLEAIAGTFRSEELDIEWTLAYDDGKLVFRAPGLPEQALRPATVDAFIAGRGQPNWILMRVVRDSDGSATALTVSTDYRLRGLTFARLENSDRWDED